MMFDIIFLYIFCFLGDSKMPFPKRLFCLLLCLVLLFSLTACSDDKAQETVSKPKPQTITIEKQEEPKIGLIELSQEAASTTLANKDFFGAEIRYYTTNQLSELQKLKLAAFSKTHNCTVKVMVDTTGGTDEIAASIASGNPYDIVENNIDTFSKTLFYDIYEPLQSSVDAIDFYSAERPEDSGLANAFSSRFTVNGNLLAVGSAQSSDFFVMYYNRSLIKKAEFTDLKQLWETGSWSFAEFLKMAPVTSFASGDALLQTPSLSTWFNIKGVDILELNGKTFVSAVTEENAVAAAIDYSNLIYGETPISIPRSSSLSFKNGKAYCMIDKASNYSYWTEIAKKSKAFENNEENLGCVVLPSDLSQIAAQSVADVRCYSALKGAKNPTAAACFALYESRSFELEKSQNTLPDDINDFLITTFNNNGFVPNFNFVSRDNQETVYSVVNGRGMYMRDGKTPKVMMDKLTPEINSVLSNIPTKMPK